MLHKWSRLQASWVVMPLRSLMTRNIFTLKLPFGGPKLWRVARVGFDFRAVSVIENGGVEPRELRLQRGSERAAAPAGDEHAVPARGEPTREVEELALVAPQLGGVVVDDQTHGA